jgi:hypothetical protein
MAGGAIHGTADMSRIEAPVTMKAYLMCAFAAFGGIFFGYDTGWMGGIMGMKYYIRQYTGIPVGFPYIRSSVLRLFCRGTCKSHLANAITVVVEVNFWHKKPLITAKYNCTNF